MKNFEQIGTEIGKLVQEKNAAYGDSFTKSGEIMRILFPLGIKPEQMDDALAIVRVLDKLFRIATAKDAFGESPWRDIAGYGILGAARAEQEKALPKPGYGVFDIEKHGKCVKCQSFGNLNRAGWCWACFSEPTKAVVTATSGTCEEKGPYGKCIRDKGHDGNHMAVVDYVSEANGNSRPVTAEFK